MCCTKQTYVIKPGAVQKREQEEKLLSLKIKDDYWMISGLPVATGGVGS